MIMLLLITLIIHSIRIYDILYERAIAKPGENGSRFLHSNPQLLGVLSIQLTGPDKHVEIQNLEIIHLYELSSHYKFHALNKSL